MLRRYNYNTYCHTTLKRNQANATAANTHAKLCFSLPTIVTTRVLESYFILDENPCLLKTCCQCAKISSDTNSTLLRRNLTPERFRKVPYFSTVKSGFSTQCNCFNIFLRGHTDA